jgi:hypothetical protein
MEEGRSQVSEQLTIETGAALFESCDILIETDRVGRLFIVANRKARAVVSTLIDTAINWDFGTPLQQWLTTAPPERRAVDLKFREAGRPDKFAVSKRAHYLCLFKPAREPCHIQFVLKLKSAPERFRVRL